MLESETKCNRIQGFIKTILTWNEEEWKAELENLKRGEEPGQQEQDIYSSRKEVKMLLLIKIRFG